MIFRTTVVTACRHHVALAISSCSLLTLSQREAFELMDELGRDLAQIFRRYPEVPDATVRDVHDLLREPAAARA